MWCVSDCFSTRNWKSEYAKIINKTLVDHNGALTCCFNEREVTSVQAYKLDKCNKLKLTALKLMGSQKVHVYPFITKEDYTVRMSVELINVATPKSQRNANKLIQDAFQENSKNCYRILARRLKNKILKDTARKWRNAPGPVALDKLSSKKKFRIKSLMSGWTKIQVKKKRYTLYTKAAKLVFFLFYGMLSKQ